MKQALLTIVTKQPENDEKITFKTRADYDVKDDGVTFNYEETLGDDEPVSTSMVISADSIFVRRAGKSGADMFFQNAATYETEYKAMGNLSLDMKIFTTNLDIKSADNGINASIDYQLFLSGVSVGKMEMDIQVKYL